MAADGTLVYLPTIITSPFLHTPVWVDRQGRETSLGMQARPYVHPRLSPDGTRVAVNERANIWIWDLVRSRLTRGPLDSGTVLVWTPDSARLIFSSVRGGGGANLYVQAADGTGTATRLSDSPNQHNPTGITADGAQIVFNEATPTQLGDISLLTMTPTPQVKPLVATRADERGGVVSPDGRWLAYESDRSGAYELWVQPFPTVDAGRWQVSTAGGVQPLWARNGRELFYVAPDGALMAVQWRGSPESAGAPTRLIEGRYSRGVGGTTVRQYDVSADGQRFLMMKEEARDTDAGSVDQRRAKLVRRAEAPRADEVIATYVTHSRPQPRLVTISRLVTSENVAPRDAGENTSWRGVSAMPSSESFVWSRFWEGARRAGRSHARHATSRRCASRPPERQRQRR